ncbi:MAG: DNA topoisomerase VI subunit B [Candidatus Aenigmarchaeota archaeon]|nr:DNA topoisomerase VI subunit B [Candidatus Aenigmarchaeota archaeon]MDI6722282.1 DNA topoisomerase VI subunit B [Candidatus Aenigmarchaeota archaeon]
MAKKTAEDFAKQQKEISISEFFEKNKHLLGFDNPTKALLMAVKEAVDNALDATEEAEILPDITVKIKNVKEDIFKVSIQDNGPGIVKEQVPRIFGKLLYGSKFHRLRESRGQQGIGISAVLLYSQLTTGNPTRVFSRIDEKKKTHMFELLIDTKKNEPQIIKHEEIDNGIPGTGIRVEMDVLGRYRKSQGVDDYLKQTSVSNPFAKIVYHAPDGTKMTFPRSVNELPKPPKEMKIHPYGVEFGILQRFLAETSSRTLQAFLVNEFSSVGQQTAREMCKLSKLDPNMKPSDLAREHIEKLLGAMQKAKVQRPPLDCLSPIGEKELEKSLKREYPDAEFITTLTRSPEVYRGNPFQIEVGIIYGVPGIKADQQIEIIRLANRVPLLYQAGACATTEAVKETDWKRYGLQQSGSNLPTGPVILVIHMCSVWVPFISESKEAIAPYPDIIKEMKLAMQDGGRELSRYLSGKRRAGEARRRIQIFERYSTEVASSVSQLTKKPEKDIEKKLKDMIAKRTHIKEEEAEEDKDK